MYQSAGKMYLSAGVLESLAAGWVQLVCVRFQTISHGVVTFGLYVGTVSQHIGAAGLLLVQGAGVAFKEAFLGRYDLR
jgi:hypothetical protein